MALLIALLAACATVAGDTANLMPVTKLTVDVGSDVVTGLDRIAALEGTIEGPSSSEVTRVEWVVVAGPGEVSFEQVGSVSTSATFSAPGVYELRLTAWVDDEFTYDALTVTVPGGDNTVVQGTIWYVSTEGSDSNSGTSPDDAFRTLNKAGTMVEPGDVIQLRGGVYYEYNDADDRYGLPQTSFTTDGTAEKPIVIESFPGELAIIDGSRRPDGSRFEFEDGPDRMQRPYLLHLPVNHYIVRNLEFRNSVGSGLAVTASTDEDTGNHNLLSHLHLHHNHGNGLTASGLMRDDGDIYVTGNVAEYIVSHNNGSTRNGGNSADGIKMSYARDGVISHSLLYKNSDDGMDFYGSTDMLVDRSLAWLNGYFFRDGDSDPFSDEFAYEAPTGNGMGFKMGSSPSGRNSGNRISNSIAWENKRFGFTFNSAGGVTFVNNTSWKNGSGGFAARCFGTTVLRNNLSFDESNTITADASGCSDGSMPDHRFNSWNLNIGDPEFVSTNPESSGFLSLANGSPAVDEGVDVGLAFEGSAPDLGALEVGQRIAAMLTSAFAEVQQSGGFSLAGGVR
ncbi:MAG TPA: right-handed parallel beta-helix repeat-containing protein [Trueperaceae bacterium]